MATRWLWRSLAAVCVLSVPVAAEVSPAETSVQGGSLASNAERTTSSAERLLVPPLTPAHLLRSPQLRFSEVAESAVGQESETFVGGGSGSGSERFDVGPALTPRDFSVGEELQLSAMSVPLLAGATDPVELAGEFEGDIVLTEEDRQAVTNGAVPGQRTWPGNAIRYVIASGFSQTERGVIAAAFRELERRTCVGVHPVPPGTPTGDFVHIVRGRGCSSAVGRLGGNQTLSLSEGCFTRGVVLHQLLHAAGLWHEQSRPDRYQYVNVLGENVAAGRLLDLLTYARVPSPPTPSYQRRSLMHLSRWAFSADRTRPTLESTADPTEPLGQRDGLTVGDAVAVNLLYGCADGTAPPLPAPPGADADCEDQNEHCDYWARIGECARNPGYMNEFCARACNQCAGSSCEDLDRHCRMWAALDRCERELSYMHVYCRRACELCQRQQPRPADERCRDRVDSCPFWARRGHCHQFDHYMRAHCGRSCGFCR
ncbi:Zinc metalloproteinase nas-13 [Amphibalanus amphitrite]|uniref:Metalloendopeptidase n=1 Tax=Amphibalanus amphitrite TaxID=1232801 RepID=A0A6A4VYE2_AMPAM|nr:Zinc metalloproteinase nas-13 [Amphibalanus amphitrite]